MADLKPIIVSTKFADRVPDGKIEFGKENVARYGVKVVYYKPELSSEGHHVYWPEGYAPPVVDASRVKAASPETPRLKDPQTKTKTQFLNNGSFVRENWKGSGMSAVYKQQTDVTCDGVVFRDWDLDKCGVFFRNYGGPLRNVIIERVRMTNAQYSPGVGAAIFMHSNDVIENVVIRDFYYEGVEGITTPGDVYAAITLAGKDANDYGSNFLFENGIIKGSTVNYTGANAGRYPNRDGIAVEGKYTDGVIRRVEFHDAADGGIDMKGLRWKIEDSSFFNCDKSIRRWSPPVEGGDGAILSVKPRECHLMSMINAETKGEWVIEYMEARSDNPNTALVKFENYGGVVRILDGDFSGLPEKQVWAKRGDAPKGKSLLILPDGREFRV